MRPFGRPHAVCSAVNDEQTSARAQTRRDGLRVPPLTLTLLLRFADVDLVAESSRGVPYDEVRYNIVKTPATLGRDPRIGMSIARNPRMAAAQGAMASAGCRVTGSIRSRKVAGQIRVSAPRVLENVNGHLAYVVSPDALSTFNASHTIHSFSFGPAIPGHPNPLDDHTTPFTEQMAMYQYHIKVRRCSLMSSLLFVWSSNAPFRSPCPSQVVPTVYEPLSGATIDSQQFSAADFTQAPSDPEDHMRIHPGVWFKFDFSAIMVRLVETHRSFLHFVTSLCAILGGIFALSGIVDQLFYRAIESSKNK
jgi:hypothetical protein